MSDVWPQGAHVRGGAAAALPRAEESEMTTIKELVLDALKVTGEKPEDLDCFSQDRRGEPRGWDRDVAPILRTTFDGLPESEYDAGYGGTEGPPFIAFSEKYVYISTQYDGSEDIVAIPRHPEQVGATIPWPGG